MERGSEEELNSIKKFLKENIVFLILLVLTVMFFCIFFFTRVSGESMCNTLPDSKLVFCSKLGTPKKGDIIICDVKVVLDESAPAKNERLIKRVIATGGDLVDIRESSGTYSVFVNGEQLDEPYIREPMTCMPEKAQEYPLTVPEGEYFVMGDNRNHSSDSRDSRCGCIKAENVKGIVLFH